MARTEGGTAESESEGVPRALRSSTNGASKCRPLKGGPECDKPSLERKSAHATSSLTSAAEVEMPDSAVERA